jgi:hypothetical protein
MIYDHDVMRERDAMSESEYTYVQYIQVTGTHLMYKTFVTSFSGITFAIVTRVLSAVPP